MAPGKNARRRHNNPKKSACGFFSVQLRSVPLRLIVSPLKNLGSIRSVRRFRFAFRISPPREWGGVFSPPARLSAEALTGVGSEGAGVESEKHVRLNWIEGEKTKIGKMLS